MKTLTYCLGSQFFSRFFDSVFGISLKDCEDFLGGFLAKFYNHSISLGWTDESVEIIFYNETENTARWLVDKLNDFVVYKKFQRGKNFHVFCWLAAFMDSTNF